MPLVAVFVTPMLTTPVGWRLDGEAQLYGIREGFEFVTDGSDRFRFSVTGAMPDVNAFDGATYWTLNHSGVAHRETRQGRDASRLVAWVLDGEWIQPGAPVALKANPDGTTTLTCTDGSGFQATLAKDPATQAPTTLTYWEPDGTTTWNFSAYKKFGARRFPTRIDFAVGKERYWYAVKSATPVAPSNGDFAMPEANTNDTSFDVHAQANLEVKHLFGYYFVHPLVDNRDVGWFFLDTGAGAMVLDTAAAKKLGVAPIGKTVAAGVVATVDTVLGRAKEFRLGPVRISRPTFLEMDLSNIGKVFKLQLGGICGYDFLARVSLDINSRASGIAVYEPGKAPLPASGTWTPFEFTGNLMCLPCRFEGDHVGYFTLDTGSGSAVDFMAPAVEKFNLLKDRKTASVQVGGAGGAAAGMTGTLKWFEIAGNRVTDLLAGFETTKQGAYASPYLDGNVGDGILGRFDLILDYRNQRLALTPYPASK
ncbi:MAG: retropepsin-like aspartic protease [Fimbriimonadaceae bacterium]